MQLQVPGLGESHEMETDRTTWRGEPGAVYIVLSAVYIVLKAVATQVQELLSAFPIGNHFHSGMVHSAHLRVSSAAAAATGEMGPMIGQNTKQVDQVLCALLNGLGIGKPEYIL